MLPESREWIDAIPTPTQSVIAFGGSLRFVSLYTGLLHDHLPVYRDCGVSIPVYRDASCAEHQRLLHSVGVMGPGRTLSL